METSVTQLIVQMVSPAVMVSACGLLLLGLGSRYSRVVDRIRAFTAEARELQKLGANTNPIDVERLRVLNVQVPDLFRRGLLLRNAVLFCHTAITLFVACSFVIPLTRAGVPASVPLVLFCAGMASVLVMTIFAWRETTLSFLLLRLEVPASAP
ncbi:MAG TPA: DUF2721 domain-containing protein [Verrucomicrobiae bacterium]|nr:DUF2721 domain-containing protein [Verrucomicrobiae bacterium]